MFIASPLLLGGAFHAGKAEFYRSASEKRALRVIRDEIQGLPLGSPSTGEAT